MIDTPRLGITAAALGWLCLDPGLGSEQQGYDHILKVYYIL